MTTAAKKRIWVALIGIALLTSPAWAQLQVGDNTTLKANATAGVGFTNTWDGNDLNSLTYGFSGTLNGDYYDERFLNWSVSPYLNQSKLNSNFYSTSSATGVNALVNFLSSSRTPMQFSYARDHNAEGTFNVPGANSSFRTSGDDQTIGLTASYLPEDWPSLQGTFSHSGSTYEVIGSPGNGSAHGTSLGLSSSYDLYDTRLSGAFTKSMTNSESPLLGDTGKTIETDSSQDSLQFGANRRLTKWSTGNFSFARTHLNADYVGASTDATFDTVSGLLDTQATDRLSFNLHVNYSSNLSDQFIADILNNGANAGSSTRGLSFTSHYLNYGLTSGYNIAHNLTATGSINRQVQGQPGFPDSASTIMATGITWSRQLLGGTMGAHYGISHYFSPLLVRDNGQTVSRESTFTGQNAAFSYGRTVAGFGASGSISYARNLTTLLVGYVQSNYTANGSLSRNLRHWNFGLNGSYSSAHVENLGVADSATASYAVSLSHSNLGLSANYSRSNGSGVQVGNNIIPNPGSGPLPEVLFRGDSYGAGLTYRPLRRWTISSTFSKLKYNTLNQDLNSINTSNQFFLRSDYHFRQMDFNFGYSHLTQGFGVGAVQPATIDTVFFGVSRRFDLF